MSRQEDRHNDTRPVALSAEFDGGRRPGRRMIDRIGVRADDPTIMPDGGQDRAARVRAGIGTSGQGWAVVVIGRNEGGRLVRCLKSVCEMTGPHPGTDVVYVDSGSSDGSIEVARQRGLRVVGLGDGAISPSRARNAGWRTVSAPFVFFVDGDCMVEPGFVRQAITRFSDPKVAVVWGTLREANPSGSLYNRMLDLGRRDPSYLSPARASEYNSGIGLIRRSALTAVKGYNEKLMFGENSELGWRLKSRGWKIVQLGIPMVRHDSEMATFAQYWRRYFRNGYGAANLDDFAARYHGVQRHTQNTLHAQRVAGLGLTVTTGLLEPLIVGSWYVTLLFLAALLTLIGREAWHTRRWANCDSATCLLFGAHLYLMQIPMLLGYAAHWCDRRRGRERGLIEWR